MTNGESKKHRATVRQAGTKTSAGNRPKGKGQTEKRSARKQS